MKTPYGLGSVNGKRTTEYSIWKGIKRRCLKRNFRLYARYGGRGITMCDRWVDSFPNFLADMGQRPSPDHSIERKDNSGPYSPDNCIWATRSEQARNRRSSRRITIGGETRLLCEWAEISGINSTLIGWRVKVGWPEHKLLSTPRRLNYEKQIRNA